MRKRSQESANFFSRQGNSPPSLQSGFALYPTPVNDVTRILGELRRGRDAADQLLPLVYEELRRIAARKMAAEPPGHILQPTALVHEAWIRLAGEHQPSFECRAHFFAAAAEAMRRILVDLARRRDSLKRGAGATPVTLEDDLPAPVTLPEELLAVSDALEQLAFEDPAAANLVKLRYFVGLTMAEAATAMNLPVRTTERLWAYARAWLRRHLTQPRQPAPP